MQAASMPQADAGASAVATTAPPPGVPAPIATVAPAATATVAAQPRAVAVLPARPVHTTAQVGARPATPAASAPSAAGAVGGTVFALLLVVGLIFGLAWIARRMPGVAGASSPALRVVASLALGPRERVVVVDVGGTQLLLGVGAGGTRALHTLDAPLPMDAPARATPFAQLLAQHFGKKA